MKKKYIVVIGISVLLIAIRLALPSIIRGYANKNLSEIKGYYGHIDDMDLSIIRGGMTINKIHLDKVDSVTKEQTNLFKSRKIGMWVDWGSLIRGVIAGRITVDSPSIKFAKERVELKDIKKDTMDFRVFIKKFMPLKVNRFEVNNGSLHYIDPISTPKVDLSVKDIRVVATNLSNVTNDTVRLPSHVMIKASIYGGTAQVIIKLDPLAREPTFDVNAEISDINLVLLNDFLKAYGDFDVNKGRFGLYMEIAAEKRKFKGYVKPLVKDLDVVGKEDRKNSFLRKLWESVVGAGAFVFKNQEKEQVGTKLSMEGSFKDPRADIIDAIWEVLSNAFIQALLPIVDHEINIDSVKKVKPRDKK